MAAILQELEVEDSSKVVEAVLTAIESLLDGIGPVVVANEAVLNTLCAILDSIFQRTV